MLSRIKLALVACRTHIDNTQSEDTVIASYLAQHLLVLLSADMQQELCKCLDKKASQVDKIEIQEYLSSTRKNIIRGVKKTDIAGFVKRFGLGAKRIFDECLEGKDREVALYGNAIENRDNVAHNGVVRVTFSELEEAVQAAEIILSAVTLALEIDNSELT